MLAKRFNNGLPPYLIPMARKTCSIYIFRHAQTYYNKHKIFTGWKDSQLTPFGLKQAKIVARKLKGKRIDVAYHTRLSRSKDTLAEVLRYHPECALIVEDNRMIERSYGDLAGKSHRVFIREHGQKLYDIYHRSYNVPPPNGESVRMVEARVRSFIKDLLKFIRADKVNVAISAHGNSMRPFRRYFEKLTEKQMMELENPWDDYFEYRVQL